MKTTRPTKDMFTSLAAKIDSKLGMEVQFEIGSSSCKTKLLVNGHTVLVGTKGECYDKALIFLQGIEYHIRFVAKALEGRKVS